MPQSHATDPVRRLVRPCGRIRQHRSGFSLVELLVSMAVLLLLVAMLSGIYSNVSKMSQLGYANNERMQSLMAITDLIRGELRSALLPINRTDVNNLQFVVSPTTIAAGFRNPDAIFWQAPVASDQTLGDVAEVGYFVKWNTDIPSNPRPALCRFMVANSAGSTNFLIYPATPGGPPVPWLTDTIINKVAPADKPNAYEGLIAENVVALYVECLDSKGAAITKAYNGLPFVSADFDSRQGFTDSSPVPVKTPPCALPPVVRLGFVLIDGRSAARIGTSEQAVLVSLASTQPNAPSYVDAALASAQLRSISQGIRFYQTEINLVNAK